MKVESRGRSDLEILRDNECFFNNALNDNGDYHLLMGSCYVDHIFNLTNKYKWYLCRIINVRRHLPQLVEFCKLTPIGVLFVTALGNAMAILTKKQLRIHPPLWRKVVDDIDKIGAPVLMIDMPAAFHRCNINKKGFLKFAARRREEYKSYVVGKRHNITHIDLMDFVSHKYSDIIENRDNSRRTKAPWHIGECTLRHIVKAYDMFMNGRLDPSYFNRLC